MRRNTLLTLALLFVAFAAMSQPVTITPPEAYIMPGESVTLTASGAMIYRWSPAYGLSETEGPVTVASPMVTTTYTCAGYATGENNSVVNGDFTQGNTGFTSAYEYNTNLWAEGTYYVDYDASLHHENFFGTGHGDGGNFMIINGATVPNTNVWTQQISVVPDTYYAFTTWVCTLAGEANEVALLQFSINGNQIGEVFSAPPERYVWEEFYEVWYSDNNTTATITILNQNTVGSGNDFGLDDISFREIVLVGAPECTVHVDMVTAGDDEAVTCYGERVEIPVLDNDHLVEGCDDPNCTIIHQAQYGTAAYENEVMSYTPNLGFSGIDQFQYSITCDGQTADATVSVTVRPANDTTLVDPSICVGEYYVFHGEIYDQDGQIAYFDTIDGNGCLKVEKLVLTVGQYQTPPVQVEYECYAHGATPSWTWDKSGITYHEDTYDEIILDDPNGGCPFFYRLDLHFHEEFYEEQTKVACNFYTWPVNGETYYESQSQVVKTFHHAFGDTQCDSTYVLHLTIADYETVEFTVPEEESCDGYPWDPMGKEYTTEDEYDPDDHIYTRSGTYHRTYHNQMGCDSIVTMHMDFEYTPQPTEIHPTGYENPSPHWVVTATEFQINSYDFSIYEQGHPNACHWDSIVWAFENPDVLWLLEPDTTTIPAGKNCKMYVLNHIDDTIWLDATVYNRCAPEGKLLRYWFVCSFYGIDDQQVANADFEVIPNPNSGQMTLSFANLTGKVSVRVYDMRGSLIDDFETYNANGLNSLPYQLKNSTNGIYFFVATAKEGVITKKVIINQ